MLIDSQCAIQGGKVPSLLEIEPANRSKDCLTKNSYKEEKCQAQVNALYECCNAFYKERGEDAKTPSCPKPSLLKLKLKQRELES